MEQVRRIELLPAEPVDPPKEEEEQSPTIRFDLPLTEPSESSCSEFSYVELVKKALGKKEGKENKNNSENNVPTNGASDDFFGEEHEDTEKLMALAMSFEAKYGPKPDKKKKVPRVEDLVDMGEGYDENDPFIDNSEAYDELVPATLTTKHGGFYINSGVLDFREVSEDSDAEFQVYRKKKKIKKKKLFFKEDGEIIKKKRKKLSSSDGDKPLKKKKLDGDFIKKRGRPKKVSPTVSELIKQQTTVPNNQNSELAAPPSLSQDLYSSGSNMEESNNGNIDDAIDSVIAKAAAEADAQNAPVLPENLPSLLLQDVASLKLAAKQSAEGKCKFFNSSVNKVLLSIELQVRNMSASSRQTVYAHLAAHLPCGQQTLVKRAKKLRLNEKDDRLKVPLQRLKDAIERAMPALWEEHNDECKAVALAKSEKMEKDIKEGKDPKEGKDSKEGKEDGSTESDDEKKEEGEGGEKEKRIMKPRKKFRWNSLIKKLLEDIVRIKMEIYENDKHNLTQTAEEYIREFLDKEVKDLWPKGWIQTRMLFKESRNIHGKWTNAAYIKPKKPMIPGLSQPAQVTSGLSNPAPAANTINAVKDEKPLVQETPNLSTPTLLDYATEKYFNRNNKSTASSVVSEAGKGSDSLASTSNPVSLSFTTTNMLRTPALEVLKNMGAMAGTTTTTKKPSESKTATQAPQMTGSLPSQSSTSAINRAIISNTSQSAGLANSSAMNLSMTGNSLPSLSSSVGGFPGSSHTPSAVTMSTTSGKPVTHHTVYPTPVNKLSTSSSSLLGKTSSGIQLGKTISSSQQLGKTSNSSSHPGKANSSGQLGKAAGAQLGKVSSTAHLGKVSPSVQHPSSSDFMSKFKEFAEKQRSPEQLKEAVDVHHMKSSEPIPFTQNLPSSATWSGAKPTAKSRLSPNSGQSIAKPPSVGISNQQHQGSALSQVYSNMQLPTGTTSFSASGKQPGKQPASVHSQSGGGSGMVAPVSSPGLHRTSPGSVHTNQSAMSTHTLSTSSMHRPVPTKYTTSSSAMVNSSVTVSSPTISHMNKSPLSSQKAHSSLQQQQQNLHSSMKTSSVSSHHDQHKKISVSSNDSWSPTGQSIDQSFGQYAQQRSSSSHSGFPASALSPQSSGMRSSGHSTQQYRSSSLSSNSPSTPDKLQQQTQQQKVSLSSSISPTEPLYLGMTLQQLEAQAMAAANMNRSTPSTQAAALAGRSWHTGDISNSSSSAFSHPHATKHSLPSTTSSLYHSAAGALDNRSAPSTYHGLNMFDLAQLGGHAVSSNSHKVMSPDPLLPPGGNLFSHQNLTGAGTAMNPHGLSPQNKVYKNPPTQHRY